MPNFIQNLLTKHRGWVIFLFAVPFSFLYQKVEDLKNWYYRTFKNTNRFHEREVRKIQTEVAKAYEAGMKMCTARSPWKTMSPKSATFKKDMAQIPISLRNVLDIDTKKMTVKVEPMVTMGDITHYLLPKGYALKIQVEMDDLTVGGLCMGLGIETTSHRFGLLFETIRSYELVTAEGNHLHVTEESYPDLFHTLPMSRGTLGFLVAVELEIVEVGKYMELEYHPFTDRLEFVESFSKLATDKNPPDFLEALVFSKTEAVIMTGRFTNHPKGGKVNPINRWYKQWFYEHVRTFIRDGKKTEFIPLRHYYHRHTPSVFFQLKDLIPFANNAWYRWLFAWMGAPKISLMKFSITKDLRKKAIQSRTAQDIMVPINKMAKGLAFIDDAFDLYPLWICPARIYSKGSFSGFLPKVENADSAMFVDLGIYGIPPGKDGHPWDGIDTLRRLEKFARDNGGFQMLYADILMTKGEFEQMFDHQLYNKVRKKYKADKAFPEVYTKVIPEKWLIDIDAEAANNWGKN